MKTILRFVLYLFFFGTPIGWVILLWMAVNRLRMWWTIRKIKRLIGFELFLEVNPRQVTESEKGPWGEKS